jgi:hypothetical protein
MDPFLFHYALNNMAINFPKPPKESVVALKRTLQALSGTPESQKVMPEEFGVASLGGAEPSLSHQVYSLGLDELRRGGGLQNARLVSWRYFVPSASTAVTSAEVNVDASGGHSFAELNSGPFSKNTRLAVETLMNDPRVAAQTYDLRLLRIPALYVTAIWLKSQSPEQDYVVPVAPTISILKAGDLYRVPEFENRLRTAAREKRSDPSPEAAME